VLINSVAVEKLACWRDFRGGVRGGGKFIFLVLGVAESKRSKPDPSVQNGTVIGKGV
jgi:hypothetical protein